ncbi:hypothetical protein GCM10023178_19430 [Actinomadura luteofluorescens]
MPSVVGVPAVGVLVVGVVSISVFLSESGNYLAPRVARTMSISLIERIGISETHVKGRGGATASLAAREGNLGRRWARGGRNLPI